MSAGSKESVPRHLANYIEQENDIKNISDKAAQ